MRMVFPALIGAAVAVNAFLPACGMAADQAARPQAAGVSAELETAAANLNSSDYGEREAASRRLLAGGLAAVPLLERARHSESPEVATRAVRILAQLYRRLPFPEAEPVEVALEAALQARGSSGEIAREAWSAGRIARERRAVDKITSLGGRVQFREDILSLRGETESILQAVQFIVLGPKWTGGDRELRYVRHLYRERPELAVYRVNGVKVSEEGFESLEKQGFRIEPRGAFLGVSNSMEELLNDQPGFRVGTVSAKSPAENAGLQSDDVVVKYADKPIENFMDLVTCLQAAVPGQKVEFTVIRDGDTKKITVELGDW